MFHRSIAVVLSTLIALAACETLPISAPDRLTAASFDPPAPPAPPPAPEVCYLEGPSCTGLCTPCPEI